MIYRNPIIPSAQKFYKVPGKTHSLDYEAIAVFVALGFFLEGDTYWKNEKVLLPCTEVDFNDNDEILSEKQWFQWHYSPRKISFSQAVDEFTDLFEGIVNELAGDQKIILPLSGGLDSRTLAAALSYFKKDVHAYSYKYENGHDETKYAAAVANAGNFPIERWTIGKGYLWDKIDEIAAINNCYTDFTNPRQVAFLHRISALGQVICLGHWGDVLFSNMQVKETMSFDEMVQILLQKIPGNDTMQLADLLWKEWSLPGNFNDYLYERVSEALKKIRIKENANASLRAWKSLNWAPRWTSVNINFFKHIAPVIIPYYDNRICEFICTVPEEYLYGRKIQIEYLKRRSSKISKIAWQDHYPFNLYNYKYDCVPFNLPYRVVSKIQRSFTDLTGKKYNRRNWELQFLGQENLEHLKTNLFQNNSFRELVPNHIIEFFFTRFINDNAVNNARAINALLTLSKFSQKNL